MADPGEVLTVDTPHGPARVTRRSPQEDAVGRLVLGHGAGGRRWTDDVVAVRDAALERGWVVDLVEQPWRVAGRRVGPGPAALDASWLAVLAALPPLPGPLVVGGRSAGARVACRTAAATGAAAVLALSFPLHPPGRPERSRADELERADAGCPVHVVQGRTDPFGTPEELGHLPLRRTVVSPVDGPHSLDRCAEQVAAAAGRALEAVVTE